MNLPNKLTMLRIILVPFFVFFMLAPANNGFLCALIIFAVASLTDALDGQIARKHNLVTNFGKLMDPLADKILVMSAMLCFVALNLAPAWVVIIILSREFLVTSLRLIAASSGLVIAADKWGKIKTIVQMIWIIFGILAQWLFTSNIAEMPATLMVLNLTITALMWASLFFTILSGFNYVWANKNLLFEDM